MRYLLGFFQLFGKVKIKKKYGSGRFSRWGFFLYGLNNYCFFLFVLFLFYFFISVACIGMDGFLASVHKYITKNRENELLFQYIHLNAAYIKKCSCNSRAVKITCPRRLCQPCGQLKTHIRAYTRTTRFYLPLKS